MADLFDTIGKNLRELLDTRGIKGKELAAMLNEYRSKHSADGDIKSVPETAVSKWLNGKGMEISSAIEIADVLNTSLDYLTGRTKIEPGNEAKELSALDDILHFDPVDKTLRISKGLDIYLTELQKANEAMKNGMDRRVYDTWIEVAQKNYLQDIKNGAHKGEYVEYEVFPKGHLESKIKMLKQEYGRLPAPAAGSIEPY